MKTTETSLTHETHEQEKRILRDGIMCPITHLIFKEPVLLIPQELHQSDISSVATIEREAYYSMHPKRCPITRIPISGFIRNGAIKSLVESYLSAYPEEKDDQYQPVNHHLDDIETGTPVTQTPTHSINRLTRSHSASSLISVNNHNFFSSPPHERHALNRQNTERFQSRCMTQLYKNCKTIALFSAGFILLNTYIVVSGMLGAFINKNDVHKAGLATAVGAPILTSSGALILTWSSLESEIPYDLHTDPLFWIGQAILASALFASAMLGQLILHGELDHKTAKDCMDNSLLGNCVASFTVLPVSYVLARLGQTCYAGFSSFYSDTTTDLIDSSSPVRTYGTMNI